MRKIFLQTIIVLFSLFVSSSCIDDAVGERKSSKDTEKLVSFVVNVAGANPSKTRALTEDDENTVKTVEVLLFDEAGTYTYQPIFSNDIVQKGPNEIAFTMKVPEGTFNMVILANAREKVINILTKLAVGMSKASVLNLLVAENTEKWNVTANSSGYQYIPMAGDIPSIAVQGDDTSIKGVMLVRMLSKIDVDTTTDVRKKFNLTSVHLYNNSVKGKIAPDTDSWDVGNGRVVKPSIPANAQNPNLGTALIYQDGEITRDNNNVGISCLNTIYTFESYKGVGDEGMSKNTCLVIGGKYDGDTKDTYYRIDFVSAKSNNKEYIALLRNHQYRVQITAVKGPGFDDPEIAFESRPVNIEASVVEWSDGDINDIVFDGQYLLGVSQSEFLFTKEERTSQSVDNDLYVVTDYPAGWTSEITDDKGQPIDWLKISPNKGGPTKIKTKLLFGENTSNQERTAYLQIKAGRLAHVVKVTQSIESEFYLKTLSKNDEYDIDGLYFISIDGKNVDRQEYNVVWRPVSSLLYYQINNIDGGGIVWDKSDGLDDIASPASPIGTYYQGHKNYEIRPMQFTKDELKDNPFALRSQIVVYNISDEGKELSKAFVIRHLAKNIIPSVDDSYDLDGEKHQFNVRSNMAYNVSVKKDDKRVLKLITTKGKEDTSDEGYPIYFELIDDAEGKVLNAEVTLLLTSPIGEFDAKEVIVNCTSNRKNTAPGANSYMVKPNGEELLIPVARCNEWQKDGYNGGSAIAKLGENEEFTAHFVWTDNSNGMASNSVVQSIGVKGKGPKGFLTVKPGSAEGNAVVAIKNTKGEIMWSWHIWNTSYSPVNMKFGEYMDRNLGALVGTIEGIREEGALYDDIKHKPKAYGLLYQWGRKDPFPASRLVKKPEYPSPYPTENNKLIYDEGGNVIDAAKENRESIHNNLQKSVLNPNVFYYSNDGLGDWLTANSNEQNNNLWSADSKSLYDPCPEGWKAPSENWVSETSTLDYRRELHQYTITLFAEPQKIYVGGLRSYNEGKYAEEDGYGYYWTANPAMINTLKRLESNQTGGGNIVTNSLDYKEIQRATGAMMRCVRYDDTND